MDKASLIEGVEALVRDVTFGLCTDQNLPWEEHRDRWKYFESLGFASLWDCDHFQQPSRPNGPYFEGWTLLAALAAETSTARLGVLVTSNTFRHPALVAKMASTIDHISGGRVEVGLGAGWYKPEHTAFGIAFPEPAELVARFRESVQVIDAMLREEVSSFHGDYVQLIDAPARPLPIQRPRPPLTLGAHGRQMLRIVAEFADRWNSHGTPQEIARRNEILDEHCMAIGRDPNSIIRSLYALAALMPADPWSSVDAFEQMVGLYSEAGIREFIVDSPSPEQFPVLEQVASRVLGR